MSTGPSHESILTVSDTLHIVSYWAQLKKKKYPRTASDDTLAVQVISFPAGIPMLVNANVISSSKLVVVSTLVSYIHL